jgi:hypothetical protein
MLKYALKEWAVICRALAEGRQSLIVRKGGIAEKEGEFDPQHARFWLFPTYLHEKAAGLKPEAASLLQVVEAERPPAGKIWLSHFVEVDGIYHVHDIASALKIDPLHLWSVETISARFFYRTPGLYVLTARVFRVPETIEIPDTEHYAGCKSWVEMERDVPTHGAVPVLDDDAFRDIVRTVELLLQPTAFV